VTDARVVLCTAPAEVADSIAHALLESRVIACANVLPNVRSHYRWKGKIESETESLLILKTTAANVEQLFSELKKLHPYEVPEMLALAVESGWQAYLEWLGDSVTG
jgi:periplasmic divalent cation tolerance protein